ncbi:unnamed protein product [Acanthoscelides obtectus]|uniref:Uncharacterized protein n=1 Tax=Acanthoscelides obtectus TaxID=200917 RepID=A0A9P0M7M3_ACAOB|nr:unnamed protein product [Acanthoscelides obtectus]CAK1623926.1 hypothetical protein AOBTE_LOCUS2235 [Acanthoscelides obtectus]
MRTRIRSIGGGRKDWRTHDTNYNSTSCSSTGVTFSHKCAPCKDEYVRNSECRKSGLNCSSMCGNCLGLGCNNRCTSIEEDIEEEEGAMFDED